MNNLKNSVRLIGNLGKDPEVIKLNNGTSMTRLSIATTDSYKNAKGEKVIETQWHNLVAFGTAAELMEKLLKKGNEVAVEGKLTHNTYEDKDGITRYSTQIKVNEFIKLTKTAATA